MDKGKVLAMTLTSVKKIFPERPVVHIQGHPVVVI